ncbi:DUF72 domain-containing protein [Thermosipho ferrireducens]|uniref:DUF72 domain-containing protein n=2 Tax=Thermosipho ferrireducens TaxID=2571116 RepID=A0ABX7S998_9BACT|nr:DUF72 domain-containing protein [Thermosipho ferrireducens]
MLSFYCLKYGFPTVELNYTFYRMPSYRSIVNFARKTPQNFVFAVKLFGGITHEKNIEHVEKFLEATKILLEERRIVGYLAQFPFSFKLTKENVRFLMLLADKIPKLFVEFRHNSWSMWKNNLEDTEIVTVDLPKIPGMYPFEIKANKILYVRLHGKNMKWFEENAKKRYDYFYTKEELELILKKIKTFHGDIFVYFNNCYRGNALKNALLFRNLSGGEKIGFFE